MESVDASSMAASARQRIHGVWTQIRSMAKVEDDRLNQWKEASVSCSKSFEEPEDETKEEDDGVFEGMMKTMFGSCTTGPFRQTATQPGLTPTSTRSSSKQQSSDRAPSPPRRPPGAHYNDKHARAAHVVNALREQKQLDRLKPTKTTSPIESTALTKPFPVSSPKKDSAALHTTPSLIKEVPAQMPVGTIENAGTFDDGISAISAYTLDEMARQEELQKQTTLLPVRSDLTSDTFEDMVDQHRSPNGSALFHDKQNTVPEEGEARDTNVPRGRSNTTSTSKLTRSTRSSKSTKSTFESNWRRNEQKYWQEVADEDEEETPASPYSNMSSSRRKIMLKRARDMRARSRSRSGDLKKQDATITTAGSSMNSGLESPFSTKHPHDTIHFDANDFFPSTETINANRQVLDAMDSPYQEDPDRIVTDQEVLLLAKDSEIGEI